MPKNEWVCASEKTVLHTPIMDLVQQECRSSEDASRTHKFFVLKSRDWCNIIPVTEDGKVVLVKQFRVGTRTHTLEIPGGVTDATDADIQATALRELAEETGYFPLPGARCEKLGFTQSNPAILNNHTHAFIVGPVRRERDQKLDAGEMIDVVEVPLLEIPGMIRRGEIAHALMLDTFFFLALRSEHGAKALVEGLRSFSAV